jgi:hypothetical protein
VRGKEVSHLHDIVVVMPHRPRDLKIGTSYKINMTKRIFGKTLVPYFIAIVLAVPIGACGGSTTFAFCHTKRDNQRLYQEVISQFKKPPVFSGYR